VRQAADAVQHTSDDMKSLASSLTETKPTDPTSSLAVLRATEVPSGSNPGKASAQQQEANPAATSSRNPIPVVKIHNEALQAAGNWFTMTPMRTSRPRTGARQSRPQSSILDALSALHQTSRSDSHLPTSPDASNQIRQDLDHSVVSPPAVPPLKDHGPEDEVQDRPLASESSDDDGIMASADAANNSPSIGPTSVRSNGGDDDLPIKMHPRRDVKAVRQLEPFGVADDWGIDKQIKNGSPSGSIGMLDDEEPGWDATRPPAASSTRKANESRIGSSGNPG